VVGIVWFNLHFPMTSAFCILPFPFFHPSSPILFLFRVPA
jgi:hypothetical protein